jgi:ribosomal protein S18 acetylase RimI-like enzyme
LLRPITADDLDAVMHITEASGLFAAEDRSFLQQTIADHLRTGADAGHGYLIDEEAGAAVGVVLWQPKSGADAVWDLTMIAVLPEHQGTGRGASMMRHVENELRAGGQRLLLVETSSIAQFDRTRAFYRRCGYDEEARVRDYWGDGDDLVIFSKRLGVTISVA